MGYWQRFDAVGAISDFRTVWRDNPYRWRVLAVSCVLSGAMFYGFAPKTERAEPRPPVVTWITTFEDGRTDAEIAASNAANQALQDERRAEIARREEQRKELFRAIGRATGVDVDAAEARFKDDEPAPAPAPAPTSAASAR